MMCKDLTVSSGNETCGRDTGQAVRDTCYGWGEVQRGGRMGSHSTHGRHITLGQTLVQWAHLGASQPR